MPISVVREAPKQRATTSTRTWKPGTVFTVVGAEYGKTINHFVPIGEGENATTELIVIDGEVTAEDLMRYNIDITDWVERKLICKRSEYVPAPPDRDEDHGLIKPVDNPIRKT